MKNIKITNLWILNNLDEMAGRMVNHQIDNEFYNYYMHKGMGWLIGNSEKIINDFYNNISKFDWELKHNSEFYHFAGQWSKEDLIEAIKEMKEEM